MTLPERDAQLIVPTYRRLPLSIARARGCSVFDAEGREYLDFFGGLAVTIIGHCHPTVVDAIHAQAGSFAHVSNYFPQAPQLDLAELLRELSGYPRVFYCNSGTEATEAAIKLSRKWGNANGKHEFLAFRGGFHGRSTGALALMEGSAYREGYEPLLPGCAAVPFNDIASLEAAVSEHTAAVFIEMIQGEGGVLPASDDFIDALYRLRRTFGFLVVADEVQTGMGRTGTFLASQRWDERPDLVLLAKGLGGGLPLGAVLMSENMSQVFGVGGHGSTFGGNPVACAAGIATLRVILRDGLLARATEIGNRLCAGLESLHSRYPGVIVDVRGRGCMIGLELGIEAGGVRDACLASGLLVNVTHSTVIRLLPPLILRDEDIERALGILTRAIELAARETRP
ncbi:MAG: acetylornithine/succinylornithine family transaminase [Ignavibacteria bacterium]|nr:acetylornithine/succinylornithine family transaminase [Ignavibacteria bacterium]